MLTLHGGLLLLPGEPGAGRRRLAARGRRRRRQQRRRRHACKSQVHRLSTLGNLASADHRFQHSICQRVQCRAFSFCGFKPSPNQVGKESVFSGYTNLWRLLIWVEIVVPVATEEVGVCHGGAEPPAEDDGGATIAGGPFPMLLGGGCSPPMLSKLGGLWFCCTGGGGCCHGAPGGPCCCWEKMWPSLSSDWNRESDRVQQENQRGLLTLGVDLSSSSPALMMSFMRCGGWLNGCLWGPPWPWPWPPKPPPWCPSRCPPRLGFLGGGPSPNSAISDMYSLSIFARSTDDVGVVDICCRSVSPGLQKTNVNC